MDVTSVTSTVFSDTRRYDITTYTPIDLTPFTHHALGWNVGQNTLDSCYPANVSMMQDENSTDTSYTDPPENLGLEIHGNYVAAKDTNEKTDANVQHAWLDS